MKVFLARLIGSSRQNIFLGGRREAFLVATAIDAPVFFSSAATVSKFQ
jgi:hypothetical protein